jgi:8-oxo-dGTP diphosphatase
MADSTTRRRHAVLDVVLQVRDEGLAALAAGGALPGGRLEPGETLEASARRHVDARALRHLEQLETRSLPGGSSPSSELATAYLGLVPTDVEAGGEWHPVSRLPPLAPGHREVVLAGLARLRAKLSYTNVGFALAPERFTISQLRAIYAAALGHDVSATNLQRVLVRRGVLEPTGEHRGPGRAGGRPAALFRFSSQKLEITDQFGFLRPPAV